MTFLLFIILIFILFLLLMEPPKKKIVPFTKEEDKTLGGIDLFYADGTKLHLSTSCFDESLKNAYDFSVNKHPPLTDLWKQANQ